VSQASARPASNLLPSVYLNTLWQGCRCLLCGKDHETDYAGFTCMDCGDEGILDARYDLTSGFRSGDLVGGRGPTGMWRFRRLLPVMPYEDHPAWSLGGTPCFQAPVLAAHLGLSRLVLKDDTGLPSGSLKDRAAAVVVARAHQLGLRHLACASTGNAAASLAVLTARAGMTSTIFVPKAAPKAKLAQLLVHGADVVRVNGSYDQAFDMSLKKIAENDWYSRNCAHNPLLVEGKKTAALEMAFTLTDGFQDPVGNLPDVVLVPVGDGCIVSSVCKGFAELKVMGLIDKTPRVIGVQAAGAAPLATAWAKADGADLNGREILDAVKTVKAKTVADSISVGIPRNRVKAWRWVASSGGGFVSVTDEAIVEAIGLLARLAGVFAEPSGATGLAGVLAARQAGMIADGDKVAVMVTGHGLKDPEVALKRIRMPRPVKP
jgi:threonine synthase